MSLLVVAVLSLLWLVFFLPSYLQSRPSSSPYLSATSFQESLRRLGAPTADAPPGSVRRPAGPRARGTRAAAARRRDTITGLSGMFLAAAVVGAYLGGRALLAPAVVGAVLAAYVVAVRVQVARRRRARHEAQLTRRRGGARSAASPQAVGDVVAEAEIVPSVRRRAVLDDAHDEALERLAG